MPPPPPIMSTGNEGVHAYLEREFFSRTVPHSGTGGTRPRAAIRRGRVVDLQLSEWCAAHAAGRRYRPRRGRRIHPYTRRLIHALTRTWAWRPLAAQVGVRVRRWRLGTRADLIVYCARTRRRILLEVKTVSGRDDGRGWARDTGARFAAPVDDVADSALNRALAQLATTALLAARDRRPRARRIAPDGETVRVDAAYVVMVSASHVRRYALQPWCATLSDAVEARCGAI